MSKFENNSIFWIEVDKVVPNPHQPRHSFHEGNLQELSESIRQYGILQPLTVTRNEVMRDDGGLSVVYELIAGERRLRASKLAGLSQVPVLIRDGEDNDQMKLELAIIENLQREDLNAIDRAHAFRRLVDEFGFKHGQVGKKVGKSREYVSNSLRLLSMPEDIQEAIAGGRITEGHARPLLMLSDRIEEQSTLFKEILFKKLTVREAEAISRRIASDRVRKKSRMLDPDIIDLEKKLTETLGTRVQIEQREVGGKVVIDFSSGDNLRDILVLLDTMPQEEVLPTALGATEVTEVGRTYLDEAPVDDSCEDDDLYAIKNFSL